MAEEMKEGFLCPICMADLGDVIQLQVLRSKCNIYAKWAYENFRREAIFDHTYLVVCKKNEAHCHL